MDITVYRTGSNEAIINLFTRTFADSEGEAEGQVIGGLVHDLLTTTAEEDIYCVTATEDGEVVGCIIFTRLTLTDGPVAFLMAPVAVLTGCQGKGTGQMLIKSGLEKLKEHGVELVFTYGDPDFYGKTGFRPVSEDVVRAPLKLTYPEGWLGQSLAGTGIRPVAGRSYCVEAFNKAVYW